MTVVSERFGKNLPFLRIDPVPFMCTGTTGTWHFNARYAAPPLNACPHPSGDLPPSGKTINDQPLLIKEAIWSEDLRLAFERSTGTAPMKRADKAPPILEEKK